MLTGCNDIFQPRQPAQQAAPSSLCFSMVAGNDNQPHSPILVDQCTGKTWLLVKSNLTDKPADGFTYQWLTIQRFDYANPTLVKR